MKINRKTFNLVFHVISITLSLVIISLISTEATGVLGTVDSFVFPNSFIKKNFNTTEPWIEYSYLIRNNHFAILETVSIGVEIDCAYFDHNNSFQRCGIFSKHEIFHYLQPDSVLHHSDNYTIENFNMNALQEIWSDINTSKPCSYFITVHLNGNYFGNLARFALIFRDLNLTKYEYPF